MKRLILFMAAVICTLNMLLMAGCAKVSNNASIPQLAVDSLPRSSSGACIQELGFSENIDYAGIRSMAMVYKASPVEVTEAYLCSVAEKMQMSEYKIENDNLSLRLFDGKGNIIVAYKASGSIFCSTAEETDLISADYDEAELLSDEEYLAAARKWVKSAGMLTEEYTEKDVLISDSGFVTKTIGGKDVKYPTLKTAVYMYRDLDGLEVNGVAPRIIVDLSLDGRVVSVSKIQRAFEPYFEYPLTSVQNAVKKLENGEGVFYQTGSIDKTGTIESVELKYYNREAMDDSPYLIPVYVFNGVSGEGQFTAVVIALDESLYTIAE